MKPGKSRFLCHVCDYSTTEKNNLQNHLLFHGIQEVEGNYEKIHKKIPEERLKRKFKCHLCDYSSAYKKGLGTHERRHTGEKPFKCHLCPFVTADKSSVRRHEKRRHPEMVLAYNERKDKITGNVRSKLCLYQSQHISLVLAHEETHREEGSFEGKSENSGDDQVKVHKRIDSKKIGLYKCRERPFASGKMDTIRRHERSRHTKQKGAKKMKVKTFVNDNNITVNLPESGTLQLAPGKETIKDSQFEIPESPSKFMEVKLLSKKNPLEPQPPGKIWECDLCDWTTTDEQHWRIHLRQHPREKPFICSLCPFTTDGEKSWKRHERLHSQGEMMRCKFCEYSHFLPIYMKLHEKLHAKLTHPEKGQEVIEIQPLQCCICLYTAKSKRTLTAHLATHAWGKPFECRYCDYSCYKAKTLKKHVKTHRNEFKYEHV